VTIDWPHFTPWASLAGGLLIGLASALLILGSGRVAGVAGIVGGALQGALRGLQPGRDALRWAFIAGLCAAPWLWRMAAPLPASTLTASTAVVVAAGLVVGFGVRMGNGCTSGHGVCGLSRFSLRSLVNVLAFIGAGVATVYVMRHLLGT
jgi:uncharacterized membrane protein YedE/YeeE